MLKPKKRLSRKEIKEDKFLTYTVKAQKYVADYGRYALYGVAGIIIVIAAVALIKWSQASANRDAAFEELQARDAYSRGSYEECLAKVESIITDYSGTQSAATALILKARILEQRGEFEQAIQIYEEVLGKHKDQEYLAFGAYFSIGAIYYGRGDYDLSARYYKLAAQKYPEHFNAPVSLVEAGRAYKKISRYDEAKAMFKQVMAKYPKSRAASSAQDDLAELEFMQ